ncbi:MAG: DUF1552 domain-containing protein [Myxococcota bacterium]
MNQQRRRRTRGGMHRRTFLKGILGGATVAVGLPLLDIFLNTHGTALADGGLLPRRFGLFYWGNGMLPERWIPEGTGDTWTLSEQLMPLEAMKSKISVITGTAIKTVNEIPHHSGIAGILTGMPLIAKSHSEHTMAGPTVDQIIAQGVGNDTRFRSIEFGAEAGLGDSHNGPNNRNPAETDPFLLFERIFGAGFRAPGETTEVDPTLALRRSVLDAVLEDTERFKKRLGARDVARLDQHMEGIRALELRLARLEEDPPDLAACMRPTEPLETYPSIDGRAQVSEKNRAMCDVMAMALACDQTRVFSNFITKPLNNLLYEDTNAGHHQLTHDEPGDQPQVNRIVIRMMEEYNYMLQALDAVPEAEGTLLDNCIVLGTSDVSYGRTHSLNEFPIILAGGGCNTLKTGIHYRSPSRENTSHVILSIIRAMGVRAASFGDGDGKVDTGLSDIEV